MIESFCKKLGVMFSDRGFVIIFTTLLVLFFSLQIFGATMPPMDVALGYVEDAEYHANDNMVEFFSPSFRIMLGSPYSCF